MLTKVYISDEYTNDLYSLLNNKCIKYRTLGRTEGGKGVSFEIEIDGDESTISYVHGLIKAINFCCSKYKDSSLY